MTGGARGIGAAIARAMADHGAKVVIGDLLERDDELLAQGLGASPKYVLLDVTRPDDWETVAMNRVGGLIETATLAVFLGAAGPSVACATPGRSPPATRSLRVSARHRSSRPEARGRVAVHAGDLSVLPGAHRQAAPYVSFDRNRYSVPYTHVRRPVTLLADATTVRVVDRVTELARHARSYDSGAVLEDAAHVAVLTAGWTPRPFWRW